MIVASGYRQNQFTSSTNYDNDLINLMRKHKKRQEKCFMIKNSFVF